MALTINTLINIYKSKIYIERDCRKIGNFAIGKRNKQLSTFDTTTKQGFSNTTCNIKWGHARVRRPYPRQNYRSSEIVKQIQRRNKGLRDLKKREINHEKSISAITPSGHQDISWQTLHQQKMEDQKITWEMEPRKFMSTSTLLWTWKREGRRLCGAQFNDSKIAYLHNSNHHHWNHCCKRKHMTHPHSYNWHYDHKGSHHTR